MEPIHPPRSQRHNPALGRSPSVIHINECRNTCQEHRTGLWGFNKALIRQLHFRSIISHNNDTVYSQRPIRRDEQYSGKKHTEVLGKLCLQTLLVLHQTRRSEVCFIVIEFGCCGFLWFGASAVKINLQTHFRSNFMLQTGDRYFVPQFNTPPMYFK